jgi:hypothetical protein
MKIVSIAVAVALGTVSLSALAKDGNQVGVVDNAFAFTAVSGAQSIVVNSAIEGAYSSQAAVALGSSRGITGTGGGGKINGGITGTGGGGGITGTGGGGH